MICPNCKCFVTNGMLECNYCGHKFYVGETKTLPVYEGASPTFSTAGFSRGYPAVNAEPGQYYRDNVRSVNMYGDYSRRDPVQGFSSDGSGANYFPGFYPKPQERGFYGKTPKLEKVYTSYTRPGVTYEVYSYENSMVPGLDEIYSMLKGMNLTNKLLMMVAVCLALIICLMLLLIV
ncbi:MAG: hypothetical protein IJM19_08665 [Ruminococcus sp.]|nr:hypothetical protein [Ruminococcus sp.]